MRKFIVLALLAAFAVPVLLAAVPDREEQWKKVDEAVSKGLPKTAIAELEPIITSAIKEKAFPEAIRAVALKISLEGNIQGNKPEEKITRLEKAIADSPRQMKPVLKTVIAFSSARRLPRPQAMTLPAGICPGCSRKSTSNSPSPLPWRIHSRTSQWRITRTC